MKVAITSRAYNNNPDDCVEPQQLLLIRNFVWLKEFEAILAKRNNENAWSTFKKKCKEIKTRKLLHFLKENVDMVIILKGELPCLYKLYKHEYRCLLDSKENEDENINKPLSDEIALKSR